MSLAVVVLVFLSSLSCFAALVVDERPSGGAAQEPARSATIVTSSFAVSPRTAYVGQVVTFFANASSDRGSCLNFTIYYDYLLSNGSVNPASPVSLNITGNPGSIVTHFIYSAPGNLSGSTYQVRLKIDDGTGALPKILTRVVTITYNRAPYFAPDLGTSLEAEIGVPLSMSVTCWDADNDDLTLTWDFGDGTDVVVETTGPALSGVECTQNHAWNPDPELWYGIGDTNITFYLNLSLSDGFGNWENTTTLIRIPLDHNFSPTGSISVSASTVDPGDTVTICGKASDAEGEPLTWTFLFSESTEVFLTQVYHTPLTDPGTLLTVNASHTFSEVGNYSVTLYLTDLALPEVQNDPAFASHNVSVGTVYVSSTLNRIPVPEANITVIPQDLRINETTGVCDALFRIQANDDDGDVLTATWDFGDGSELAVNVSLGGIKNTFRQAHQFTASGQYNVSVVITDGRPGHEVVRYKLIIISSSNSAPEIRDLIIILSNSSYGLPGSVVQFKLLLYDLERDPLEVSWNFGDGSPIEWSNVTLFNETGIAVCYMNHTYWEVGDYTVLVNFTDRIYGLMGYHMESWNARVVIDTKGPEIVRVWDWWDYTSLGLFSLSIGLLFLWAIMGSVKRGRLDTMGTTMEEYLLRKQEIERFDERHKMDEEGPK